MTLDLSVLIPLFNERDGIPGLVSELNAFFAARPDLRAEVIFIDDGSSDGSADALGRERHKAYQARVIRLSRNYGSHSALRAGILHARGSHITFLPADLQDPPELIDLMLAKARGRYEIVLAARESIEGRAHDNFFSGLYARLMRRFVNPEFPERGFDIALFSHKVKGHLDLNPERDSSLFLQILSLGFKSAVLTYSKRRRRTGSSKWTLKKKLKLVSDSVFSFSDLPVRMLGASAVFFAALSAVSGAYFLLSAAGGEGSRSAGLLAAFFMGCSILQSSLTVIAEYARRISVSRSGRPVYVISEIRDLTP